MIITLDGLNLEQPILPFTVPHEEQSQDNITLDGTLYTDFTSVRQEWHMRWERLTEAQYNALRSKYDAQFVTGVYPTLVIPKYSINSPVRMTMSDKNLIFDGNCVRNVRVQFKQKQAI